MRCTSYTTRLLLHDDVSKSVKITIRVDAFIKLFHSKQLCLVRPSAASDQSYYTDNNFTPNDPISVRYSLSYWYRPGSRNHT